MKKTKELPIFTPSCESRSRDCLFLLLKKTSYQFVILPRRENGILIIILLRCDVYLDFCAHCSLLPVYGESRRTSVGKRRMWVNATKARGWGENSHFRWLSISGLPVVVAHTRFRKPFSSAIHTELWTLEALETGIDLLLSLSFTCVYCLSVTEVTM